MPQLTSLKLVHQHSSSSWTGWTSVDTSLLLNTASFLQSICQESKKTVTSVGLNLAIHLRRLEISKHASCFFSLAQPLPFQCNPSQLTWSSSHCYPVWFESVASTRDLMSPNFFFFCIAICFCWNTLQSNYLRSHPQNSLETTSIYQCQDRLNQSQSLMLSVAHLSNSLETSMQSKGEGWGFIFLQAPELLRSWSHLGSDLTHWTVISNNSHHGPLNVSKRKTHVFHRCHHSHMIMCPAIVNDTSNLFVCYYIHM